MPASLGAGASITLGVAFTAPASGAVSATATIDTSTSQGPNTQPDTSTSTAAISPLADVSASVSLPASAVAGSTVNGTVKFGNNGPSTAAGVTYTVGLPPGLADVVFTGLPAGATATYAPATGAVTLAGMPASLGAGTAIPINVSFTAPSSGAVVVSGGIGTSTSQGPNTLPDTSTSTTAISPVADVGTSVSIPATAIAGAPVSGTVTFSNSGPSMAAGVSYTLGFPPGLTGVTFSGLPAGATATYNSASGAVTFAGMPTSLGSGSSIVVGIGFTAPTSGSVAVTATIDTTTSQGANAISDSDTGTTAVSPLADVTTTISAPPTAVAGTTVNATVSFSNVGPSTATGVTFTLSLAPGLSGVVITGLPLGATASYNPATGAITLNGMPTNLGAGSGITLGVAYVAPASGSVAIVSNISTATSQGLNAQPDNATSASAISALADVTVSVTIPATAAAGGTVSGSVTFRNNGPSAAAGTTFTLTFPAGLAGVNVSGLPPGAMATYNPATGAVTFSGMPTGLGAGSSVVLGVTFTAPATGSVAVSAAIGTTTSQGANASPDSDTQTTAISTVADVTTSVSVPSTAVAGNTVNGTVTYSNAGPSTATGLAYTLNLGAGLSGVSISGLPAGATAAYNAATGAVTFTGMPVGLGSGSSLSLGVTFTAPPSGSVSVNSQIATSTSQGANTLADTAVGTTAISPLADVTTSVSVPPTATAGTTVNATVTYSNAGPSTATGVTYALTLAPGLSGVIFSGLPPGATVTYNPANGTVVFTGMPTSVGAGSALTIGVSYTAPLNGGAVAVTSGITTTTSQGPNTLPDVSTSTTAISANADVTTTVSVPATAAASGTVSGTITYGNAGPSPASGVTYSLGLSTGLTGVNITGLPGGATATYDPATGGVTLTGMPTSLPSGTTLSLGLGFTAPATGTVMVSSRIGTSTAQGANTLPDTATGSTAISPVADVTTSIAAPASAVAGSTVNATVTFRNAGPSTAAGVIYGIGLPPGLTGVTFSGLPAGAMATYDPSSGAVTLTGMPTSLSSGAIVPIGISFTAPATGSVAISSSIGTSTGQGANTLPDAGTTTTAISPLADVTTTISLPPTATSGTTVNGTVTFSNTGPSTAAGMTYTLGLPPGLAGVVFSGLPPGATATYNPSSGAVTLTGLPGTLNSGAGVNVGISFTAPSSGAVTANSSVGTSTSQGPNAQPDSATATSAISPLADVTTSISLPPTATAGATVSGTITYTNAGPSIAAGTTYTLGLPPGLVGVTFSGLPAGATAAYDAATGAVTFTGLPGSLGQGASVGFSISFTAPTTGAVTMTSAVSTSTSQGPNVLTDSATATTAISPLADVTTSVSLPPSAVAAGTVNGTITFSNAGPSTAAGVTFTIGMASGLTNVVFTGLPAGALATYDPASGAVTLTGMPATLGSGSNLTIGVAFTAPATGTVTITSAIATTTSQGPNTLTDSASAISAISPLADVTVNVSLPATAPAGATVNGSVTFSNAGPSPASGMTFALALPPGLVGVSFTGLPAGTSATYDVATGAVTFAGMPANLGAGSGFTVGVTFTAPPSGSVTMTASIGTSTSQGPNTLPDSASATAAISPIADVTTSVSLPPQVIAGATVNGSVTFGNAGPSTANGVSYQIGLPPGLSGVSFNGLPAGATVTYNAATGAVTFNGTPVSLGAGATLTLGVTFTAPATGIVAVTATMGTTTGQGPNTLPDSATATTAISPLADVTTSVSVPPSAVAGSIVNGSVTFSNAGPSTATGITYTLTLPSGLTGVSFSGLPVGATATYDPATGSVTFTGMPVSLGAGATLTPGVTFTAPVNGAVTITSGINTSTSQGSNTLPDTATATSAVSPLADVTTTVSLPPVAIASSVVNGTIAFSNAGPSTATGMVYAANLTAGLGGVTFTGLPAGATAVYNAATGAVTFSGMPAALGAGTSLSIGVAFIAPATGSVTVATSVSTATSQGPNTLPDTSSSTSAISPLADVTTSASFPPTALGGSAVNGSVTFANNGPSTATGVTYTLSLSTGLTNVVIGGLPAGAIATYNPATGIVTFTGMPTSLGAGSTIAPSVSFTAPPGGSAIVSSTIGTATSQGSNMLPDNASRTTVVSAVAQPTADLAIVKVLNGTIVAGGTASYTITVTNNGPSGVAGATVVDTAPAGMTIGNWSCAVTNAGSGGALTTGCGTTSGTGNLNTSVTMKNGAVITYTLPVTYSAAITGSIANSASVSVPGGTTDPSSGNNTTTDTSSVNLVSDLSITKTSTPNPFVAGGTLTYTIIASNAGPSNATGVRIQDNLPTPLSSFTWTCVASGAGAACGAASGSGSIDQLVTLAAGTQVTYTLTGTVPVGTTTTLNNTASITPPATTTDPTPNNNTVTNVNSAAALADMTVVKSHIGTFAQGQVGATYTITVTNAGAAAKTAGNVVAVIDTPPAGVTITAMGGTGWNCVNLPMCLRTDALAAGASYPALTVVVTIGANATSPLVNMAEVSLTGQLEANYNNNTATDSAIVGQLSLADLTIVKTHGGDFNQGQIARFSIVVTNAGGAPKLAGNLVSVTELPPAAMTITVMRGDGWVCDTLPTCTRTDALAAGTSYPEVVVIARIAANASSPLGNGARVALTGQLEIDPNNNTVIDPAIVVAVPDLVVAKSHVGDFVAGQRGVQFSIVVSNAGSASKSAGNTVEVSEDVPFGLTITSMSGSGWSCPSPGAAPICTRTDLLSPGASYPPIIVIADVAMNAVSPLFNGATVILSGQSESEYGNNFAVDQASIIGSPVPTLGTWALWLLVLAIGGCGAFGSRRHRGRRVVH